MSASATRLLSALLMLLTMTRQQIYSQPGASDCLFSRIMLRIMFYWHSSHAMREASIKYYTHAQQGLWKDRASVRLSVCPIMRLQPRLEAGLLLSAVSAGDIDWQLRRLAPSSSGAAAHAAARRSAANASSATFTANVGSWIQTSFINVVHSTVLLRHIVMSVDDSFVLLTADHRIASTLRSMRLLLVGEMEENRKITKQKKIARRI